MIQNNTYLYKELGIEISVTGVIENLVLKSNGHTHFDLEIKSSNGNVIEKKSFIYEVSISNKTIQVIKEDIYDWLADGVELISLPDPEDPGSFIEEEKPVLEGNWVLVS